MQAKSKKWWEFHKSTTWWRVGRNLPVFWLNQGLTYMDTSEKFFHLSINFILAIMLYAIFHRWQYFGNHWNRVLVAAIGARTINFIFNAHFWDVLLVNFLPIDNGGEERIRKYLINSARRLSKCPSIYFCGVYGSLARGKFHKRSDLDIRYVRQSGFFHAIIALSFTVRERVIAFFAQIPLDLYIGDSDKFLDKMRDDEIPIVLKSTDTNMAKRYPNYVPLKKFLDEFRPMMARKVNVGGINESKK